MDKFKNRDKEFEEICKKLLELFSKKNRDYGDSYFENNKEGFAIDKKLSEVDFYLQIRRKVSRLASFAEKKLFSKEARNLVEDETEEDTIMDIAVYSIMELIKLKGGKDKDGKENK